MWYKIVIYYVCLQDQNRAYGLFRGSLLLLKCFFSVCEAVGEKIQVGELYM